MYIVYLVKDPETDGWKPDYFPRKFRYKKDAKQLRLEVYECGGLARIYKIDKQGREIALQK